MSDMLNRKKAFGEVFGESIARYYQKGRYFDAGGRPLIRDVAKQSYVHAKLDADDNIVYDGGHPVADLDRAEDAPDMVIDDTDTEDELVAPKVSRRRQKLNTKVREVTAVGGELTPEQQVAEAGVGEVEDD